VTPTFALAPLVAGSPLSFAERVEGTRAVEGAPFDEDYPRSVFEVLGRRGRRPSDAHRPRSPQK
jgi:hypothetical protein